MLNYILGRLLFRKKDSKFFYIHKTIIKTNRHLKRWTQDIRGGTLSSVLDVLNLLWSRKV